MFDDDDFDFRFDRTEGDGIIEARDRYFEERELEERDRYDDGPDVDEEA